MNIKTIMVMSGIWCLVCAPAFAEDAPVQNQDAPTQQLEGFNLNGYTTGGKKSWEINGDKADISDEKIKITNVDANAFDKQKVNLKSRTGTINKINGDINLKDNVVITAERGTQMTTDTLDWKRNQDLITTKDPVKIVDKQGVITGIGLTAHPNLKQAAIDQDIKAVLNTTKDLKPDQTATITCDGPMQMDQLKMVAVFNVNVVAVEASTGRQLYADKMTVYFDDKNKKIRKVICTGHVKAIQGVNASYADEMVYDGDGQQLTMTGRPKLVFDTSENKGSGLFPKLGK
jgi:LPS export ABC transporter protein LptC